MGTMPAYDVIVAGGGVAGVSAAVASSRGGARTLLAEREPRLGGLVNRALLREVCGFYENGQDNAPVDTEDTLNPGLQREIAALLQGAGSPGPRCVGRVHVLPFPPGAMAGVLHALVRDEDDLTLRDFSALISARAGESGGSRRVLSVEIEGMGAVEAGAFVDATGNAELALLSGAATEMAPVERMQLAGFTVELKGIRQGDDRLNLEVPYCLRQAVENGALPDALRYSQFSYGDTAGQGFIKFSVAPRGDSLDTAFRGFGAGTPLEKEVDRALEYICAHIPALEEAEVVRTSEGASERDGRLAVGECVLTENDIRSSRRFEDEVCLNAWPMELWEQGRGPVYEYPSDDSGYGVPAGCLRARGFANLFLAGRSVSATRGAMGSLRVMGACIATGEQAGLMAAREALSV